jgi:hypothetical protein
MMLALLSCRHNQRSEDPFPEYQVAEEELIPYEGILPSADGLPAEAELQLRPGPPGMDGDYFFYQRMIFPKAAMSNQSRGKYTVLVASAGERIIRIRNCRLVHRPIGDRMLRPEEEVTCDLYFRTTDGNELILVDKNYVETEPRHILIRRSELFTAEGYVTVYEDSTAEFFERNTRKKWPLARYGHYAEVVKKYHSTATQEFEGIYLKALSYTVSCRQDNGERFDAVVFKTILDMDTARAAQ